MALTRPSAVGSLATACTSIPCCTRKCEVVSPIAAILHFAHDSFEGGSLGDGKWLSTISAEDGEKKASQVFPFVPLMSSSSNLTSDSSDGRQVVKYTVVSTYVR